MITENEIICTLPCITKCRFLFGKCFILIYWLQIIIIDSFFVLYFKGVSPRKNDERYRICTNIFSLFHSLSFVQCSVNTFLQRTTFDYGPSYINAPFGYLLLFFVCISLRLYIGGHSVWLMMLYQTTRQTKRTKKWHLYLTRSFLVVFRCNSFHTPFIHLWNRFYAFNRVQLVLPNGNI